MINRSLEPAVMEQILLHLLENQAIILLTMGAAMPPGNGREALNKAAQETRDVCDALASRRKHQKGDR